MSSSEDDSKIDLLDSPANVKKKIKRAFCEPGNITDNGLLSFVKHVLYSIFKEGEGFEIHRKPEFGGNAVFGKYEDLEKAYAAEEVHPGDLKLSVENYINRLLEPIRKSFADDYHRELTEKAYPTKKEIIQKVDENSPDKIELKVGKILEATEHPDADALCILKVDVGNSAKTVSELFSALNDLLILNIFQIVSNLKSSYDLKDLIGLKVVVLTNLKASKVRGVESDGIVLCANK